MQPHVHAESGQRSENNRVTDSASGDIFLFTLIVFTALYVVGVKSQAGGCGFIVWLACAVAAKSTARLWETTAKAFSSTDFGRGCLAGGYIGSSVAVPVSYMIGTLSDFSIINVIRFGLPVLNAGFVVGLFIEAASRPQGENCQRSSCRYYH